MTEVPPGATLSSGSGLRNSGNRLAGPIPPELGELANLETLSLDSNELSGSIPPELGKLANLKTLSLSRNRLTGTLPRELGNLIRLESLSLAVSYDLTLTPPRPRYVLSGPLPPQLGNLVRLKELDLRGQKFTGRVPSALARLGALEYLSLTCNSPRRPDSFGAPDSSAACATWICRATSSKEGSPRGWTIWTTWNSSISPATTS